MMKRAGGETQPQPFPDDFMFQLSAGEFANLRSQSVTSSSWDGRRTAPYAFTEQGVATLSSVLRSPRAISVNIEIMRAFVRLLQIIGEHRDLERKLDDLERRYDANFQAVFDAILALINPDTRPKKKIGYLDEILLSATASGMTRRCRCASRRPT